MTAGSQRYCGNCGMEAQTTWRAGKHDLLVANEDIWLCESCSRTYKSVQWKEIVGTWIFIAVIAWSVWDIWRWYNAL